MITLNAISVAQLANAAASRFAAERRGTIIRIASAVGLVPEYGMSVYGATKAFVIFLLQGLAFELGPKYVYVQAVLPAGTRTELWERGSLDPATLQPMMDVNDLSTPRCRALTSARRSPFRRCPMQHFGMPIRPRVRP